MSYKGPKFEGPRPPQSQKDANPLALCRIASADGVRPFNMTSFIWIQMDHNVAKIVCHSTSRQSVSPPRDRQNASFDPFDPHYLSGPCAKALNSASILERVSTSCFFALPCN